MTRPARKTSGVLVTTEDRDRIARFAAEHARRGLSLLQMWRLYERRWRPARCHPQPDGSICIVYEIDSPFITRYQFTYHLKKLWAAKAPFSQHGASRAQGSLAHERDRENLGGLNGPAR